MATRGPKPKPRPMPLLNGAKVGSVLLSHGHGALTIIDLPPDDDGTLCVVCKTRGGFEIDLSAAYAGKLAVLAP